MKVDFSAKPVLLKIYFIKLIEYGIYLREAGSFGVRTIIQVFQILRI